jgi:chromosomal replication initiation ATPase DnaA
VCEQYGVAPEELATASRSRLLAEIRGVVAWLARRAEVASLTDTAARYGRDVTTLSRKLSALDGCYREGDELGQLLNAFNKAIIQA